MKQRIKKLLLIIPTVILILGACLVIMVALGRPKEDVPALSDGVETSPDETVETPETTEPPVLPDPSSRGLDFESLGNGTCMVIGMGNCTDRDILLPTVSPDGDVVVGIADYAFRGETSLRSITFTPAVRTIGDYAFYGSGLVFVEIPAEIASIGEYAFCGCYALQEIRVDADSPSYSDQSGVLFNKDGTVILCYPAGRTENFYTITAKVREIRTMAFYKCNAIKLINYVGTGSEFRTIRIGAGNEAIETAVITYSSSTDLFSDGNRGEK